MIQLLIRRIVQTTINGSSIKFRSPRLSILVAALADLPDDDAKVAAVLSGLGLWRAAPTAIQQDGDGLYACSGWRIGLTHDGGKRAHGLACISPAQ
jgi:hypothetical protein